MLPFAKLCLLAWVLPLNPQEEEKKKKINDFVSLKNAGDACG